MVVSTVHLVQQAMHSDKVAAENPLVTQSAN